MSTSSRRGGGANPPPAGRQVVMAVITGAHGIAGDVRLKLFGDDPASLIALRQFNQGRLTLTSLRENGIARFAEIPDRNAAEAMRGTELTVSRESLPPLAEGEYYHADLIGLSAVSTTGEPLGLCVAIDNFGAGDILEIERPSGKRFMVPMTQEAVPEWGESIIIDAAFDD